jgi:hypothetical protein
MSNAPYGLRRAGDDGRWRAFITERLASLQINLPSGSDSWTAHGPANDVVKVATEAAEKFVTSVPSLLPNPFIAATSEGGVQVKWVTIRCEFSLFVYPDQSIEYFWRNGRDSRSGDAPLDQIGALANLVE